MMRDSYPPSCPSCQVSFQGEPIPQEYLDAGYYGDATHYSTVIGIYDFWADCVMQWRCPSCEYTWEVYPARQPSSKSS